MPIILGLRSSCDETAAALVGSDPHHIRASPRRPGSRASALWRRRARDRGARTCRGTDPAGRSGARGRKSRAVRCRRHRRHCRPGLIGGVMVGLVTGKALAHAAGKPLIAVNHLEGHALSPRLADPSLRFPYLLLLVSGSRTQLLEVRGVGDYRRLATARSMQRRTRQDREAARTGHSRRTEGRGAGTPEGNPRAVPLPRRCRLTSLFSFASLKSAIMRAVESSQWSDADIAELSAGRGRCRGRPHEAGLAIEQPTALVVAGGVAANGAAACRAGSELASPPRSCRSSPRHFGCTMRIILARTSRMGEQWNRLEGLVALTWLFSAARPRWPLDQAAEAVRGAGEQRKAVATSPPPTNSA